MNKQLTKAEEQIMQILWSLGETSVNAIMEQLQEPKPAKTTVSTIVRILESKDFVGHKKKGRGYLYFPMIEKSEYTNHSIHKLMDGYFGGSFQNLVSFFVKENKIDVKELDHILKQINKTDQI